jgi:hypothetical protein
VALAALAVATMLATQGCDVSPAAQASAPAHPDVTFTQARAVYQTYLAASDTAAAQGDSATGLSNVADATWAFTHAEYTALASTGTAVPRYVYGTPAFYVPIVSGYPHWFAVNVPRRAADSSPASNVGTLMVFGQSTKGGTWTLDGNAALAPGEKMPAITTDANGYAIAMPPSQQGLLLQPNAVGGSQASVVDEGSQTAAGSLVPPGPQTTDLYNQQSAIGASTPKDLEYLWAMVGTAFPVFALQTTSGAALVLYGMALDTSLEYPNGDKGAPIPVPAVDQPQLASPGEAAVHAVSANWTYEFATIDPPASVHNGQLSIIAATGALTYSHAY